MHAASNEATAASCPKGRCVPFTADVTLEKSWTGIVETASKSFATKFSVVVNCAGVVHIAAPSHTVPEDQFDLMFKVNVKPLYLSTKVVVPFWKENGIPGQFINLSSISEPRPRPNLVWYAASKGAVTVVSRTILAIIKSKKYCSFEHSRPREALPPNMPRIRSGTTALGRLWVKLLCEHS